VFSTRTPRNTSGRPGTSPCSLPEATSEPANVSPPIDTSSTTATVVRVGTPVPGPASRT
jgi:hypothetical protein